MRLVILLFLVALICINYVELIRADVIDVAGRVAPLPHKITIDVCLYCVYMYCV